MLIPVSRLFFHIVLQNIGYDARALAERSAEVRGFWRANALYSTIVAAVPVNSRLRSQYRVLSRQVRLHALAGARDRQRRDSMGEIAAFSKTATSMRDEMRGGCECPRAFSLKGIRAPAARAFSRNNAKVCPFDPVRDGEGGGIRPTDYAGHPGSNRFASSGD